MLRWLAVLTLLSLVTGLLTFGVIPTEAIGLTRILFAVFATALACSLVLALARGD